MRRAAALLLAAAACSGGEPLSEVVEPLCKYNSRLLMPDMELPVADGALPQDDLPTLVMNGATLTLDHVAVTADALPEALRAQKERREMIAQFRGKRPPPTLAFAGKPATATSDVAAVADAAHRAGYEYLALVTAPKTPRALPRPSKPQKYANVDPAERAFRISLAVEESITFCPDLENVFSAIASADPSMKCQLLAHGLREVEESSWLCLYDKTALRDALLHVMVPQTIANVHTLRFDPTLGPADLPPRWGDAVAAILERSSQRIWLAPESGSQE